MVKKILFLFVNIVCFQLATAQGTTPCNAIQLYPYTTCANTSGMQYAGHYQTEMGDGIMVTMSGTSTLNPACTTDNETSQPVEWLMVTATTTSFTITNLTDYSGPGATTAETRDYAIYSGTCGSLTQIACSADIPRNGTVNVTGLTAGQNYYIMVSQSAAAYSGYPTSNGVATCITSTVPHTASNNNCSGAFVLANNVTYSSTNADGTADGPSVCQNPASGSVENNVWYQWCAPSTWTPGQTAFLNVNNQVCNSTQGLQLSIYDDTTNCADITAGTATSLVCQNPGATTNYNYTFTANPNQCYLIVLDGFAGTSCTYNIQVSASASTCVTPPTVTATSSVDPICPSGSTTLTASCAGSCTGITYTWSPATGLSGTAGASVTANPAVTTTYTVTGTTATCTATATVTVNVNPLNTITAGSNQTVCINTAMTNITMTTTGATGATVTGLPAGVTGSWAANVVTISGTPTAAGVFNYTVTTTGGCPPATATGTITVNPQNTITAGSNQTVCINTAMTNITMTTTGATGATVTGLPAGVTGSWAANVVTISGTPTAAGVFNYTVTTTGGCPPATATGTITVNPQNTITAGSNQTVCINTAMTNITMTTTGATGATVTGLPAGVTGSWAANVVTISGTPTAAGVFNYTVTTTGGCPPATATGTITVNPQNTITAGSNQTVCINTAMINITMTTTGATGATVTGLPAGVTGSWAANVVTISGTPTAAGVFNYTVTTTGGCPPATATGTITVNPQNTITAGSNQTICINTAMTNITMTTTGATGATVTGLPAGVTGSWAANVVTISGTPTAAGVFNYTVTTTGGCPPATATGTITVNPQNTITAGSNQTVCINTAMTNITMTTTGATGATVTGLPAGVTGSWAANVVTISGTPTAAGVFNYTVTTTGGCPPATATGTITVNPQNTITAGSNQTVCINTAMTNITMTTTGATGATVTGLPAGVTGSWAANVVTISGTPTAAGVFNYTVTTTGGCPPATATGTITVNPQNTITAGSNQTVCINTAMTNITMTTTGATGATVTGLPAGVTGSWAANVVTISGTPTAAGVFNYTVTTTGGCPPATATGTITVNSAIVPVTGFSYPTPICQNAVNPTPTGVAGFTSGGTYSSTAGLVFVSTATGEINLMASVPGTYTVTYTFPASACGPMGSSTFDITITPLSAIVLTSAATTNNQSLCQNTVIVNITYSVSNATGASVTGLPAGVTGSYAAGVFTISGTPTATGTFNYTVTTTGGCTPGATATGSIIVNAVPAIPTISTTAPTCSSDGVSTIANYDGTVTYTFTPSGPTVGVGGLISGMTVGMSYTVTAGNGSCTSSASASFSNGAMLVTPAVPTISTTAPTCAVAGSSAITNYDGTVTYIFTPSGPTVGAGGSISGMTVGMSYTVTAGNGSCTSVASLSFSNGAVLAVPAVPTISTTVPTCSSDGVSTITNYDGTVTYTFTPSGPTVGAGGLISGMTVGMSYTVTAGNGSCTSSASASFSNGAMLVTPAVPTISTTAPTCSSDGVSTITNYDGTVTYTFTPSGPTVGAGGSISGMTVGMSYTVTAGNGSCTSVASLSFSNGAVLAVPAIPTISTTVPTCSSDGVSTITNYDGTVTYTFTPSGPTVGAGGLISGMTVGMSYTVTAGNGSCTSSASASFSNGAMLVTPAVPTISTTAPTCAVAGSSTITNYDGTVTYIFTPSGPTVGAGGSISGMTVGMSYTVTAGNGSCTSAASLSFSNGAVLAVPAIPTISTIAPTCSSDGVSTITNYDGTVTYTFTPSGPTVGASGLISGMTVGMSYTVTAGNGSCTSSASASFSNGAMLVTPAVPTISTTAPTCAVAGSSTITNYDGTVTYIFTPSGPTVGAGGSISGMTVGMSYTVTAGNGSCTSAASLSFSNGAVLAVPAIPTISTTVPTCSSDGVSTITNYDGTVTYTFTPSGPTVGAGGLISGMTVGMSYTVTAGNGSCTSSASASFSNGVMLVTPAVPTISTTAPTCSSDGVSTITNYDGTVTYTFTPSGPTVDSSGVASGMDVGVTYTVVADNGNCTSGASLQFVNDPMILPIEVSFTSGCVNGAFTLVATPNNSSYSYEWFDSSNVSLGTSSSQIVTSPGVYRLEVDNGNGCISTYADTVNDVFCNIPRGISPNNDGYNDNWDIAGLNARSVHIFNRYGVTVYEHGSGYTNQWYGQSKGGDELPDGTYYYVIETGDGSTKTGWVYINREQ